MLKLSKDKGKFKRRIPFNLNKLDLSHMTKCMIYVENFPGDLQHQQLATIFSRAGKIRHISIPKFKNSKMPKGFAFIEFATEEEASKAVAMFNNTVP